MLGEGFFCGSILLTFLIGITTVLLYRYFTRNFDIWKEKHVPFVKPVPIFGSFIENLKRPLHETELKRYENFGRIYGYFEGNQPVLSVAEPAILRNILVKDFHIFPSRRLFVTGEEMLDKMLFNVQGEDWKRIRTIITRTFSTGKIKKMMSIMKDCAETAVENFKTASKNGNPVDLKRIYGAFTMDVIASSAFSTKIDSHNDANNEFVKTAKMVFAGNINWRFITFIMVPKLMRWLKISVFSPSVTNFFRDVTLQIIQEREKTGQGELTYDALQSVTYLDHIISESMRLFPPAIKLERQASTDYELGETGIIISKGTVVSVPVYAMQRDPQFFPNPEMFDPDRWTTEERIKREQYLFLPFGAGPRNCVGMRFALTEVKICLAYMILNFQISRCPQTKVPLEFNLGMQGVLQPKGIAVAMETRKDKPLLK